VLERCHAEEIRSARPVMLRACGGVGINQEDLAEKSAQVALMPAIYQAASRVIVWLGDDASDNESALKILSVRLECYHKERPPGKERYAPTIEPVLLDKIRARGFPEFESSCWMSLS
jgi:hypothetical protein